MRAVSNSVSTEFKPISDTELIKRYAAFDANVYNTVKNYQDNSVTGLLILLAGIIGVGVNNLINSNKQFATSLNPEGMSRVESVDTPQQTSPSEIKNSTFIELSSNLQHAGEQLMTRLIDKVDAIGKQPEHINTVKQAILEGFAQEGITTIQYKNGAKVRLNDYVQMATRTARTETANSNAVTTALDNGTDLVYMPKLNSTCPICAKYEGRVYSISGNDKRFPHLYATAFSRGFDNIHPNCRHHLQPFFEQHYTPGEINTLERDSNRVFDDDRTNYSVKTYNKAQAYNRQILTEIREFDEMKATFGNDMPYRTVGGFRRGRRADSETYELWKQKLREAIVLQNLPEDGIVKLGDTQIKLGDIRGHFWDRGKERYVYTRAAVDALNNPLDITPVKFNNRGEPSRQIIGGKATVVVNPDKGSIITVWPTSTKRREKLEKRSH